MESFGLIGELERLQSEHGVLLSGGSLSTEAAVYVDYRKFLSRRLACLRQQLKLTNSTRTKGSHRSFVLKEPESCSTPEEVMVAALPAERAWARSQELKFARNLDQAEDRLVKARLKKAVLWATKVESMYPDAKPWVCWLRGLAAEKCGDLSLAVEELSKSYSERASPVVSGDLKRCQYALTGRVDLDDEEEEDQNEAIEWCGHKLSNVPVALRRRPTSTIAEIEDLLRETEKTDHFGDKEYFVAKLKYEKLQLISERILAAVDVDSWKRKSLSRTAELMMHGGAAGAAEKEPTGAETLVQLYDHLCQLAAEMAALPGVEDEVEARAAKYKAFKCYFLAELMFDRKQYDKALVLFKHTDSLSERALLEAEASNENLESAQALLTELSDSARGGQVRCKIAHSLLSSPSSAETSGFSSSSAALPTLFVSKAQPLPLKPFVFDVAHDALSFPIDEIQAKLDGQQSAGLFGWFRRRR